MKNSHFNTLAVVYFIVSGILVIVIPGLVMYGEDGNLLVRLVMMACLALLFYLIWLLIKKLSRRA